MPNSRLYDLLCADALHRPEYRWVFDPESGKCFFNEAVRLKVHLLHNEYFMEETRGWITNYEEAIPQAIEQIKTRDHYAVVTDIRTHHDGIEHWRARGEWMSCEKLGVPMCSPACDEPRCRVILGISVRVCAVLLFLLPPMICL